MNINTITYWGDGFLAIRRGGVQPEISPRRARAYKGEKVDSRKSKFFQKFFESAKVESR